MPTDSVTVAVRLRPFNTREKNQNESRIITIGEEGFIQIEPADGSQPPKKFNFDFSYDWGTEQVGVGWVWGPGPPLSHGRPAPTPGSGPWLGAPPHHEMNSQTEMTAANGRRSQPRPPPRPAGWLAPFSFPCPSRPPAANQLCPPRHSRPPPRGMLHRLAAGPSAALTLNTARPDHPARAGHRVQGPGAAAPPPSL
eukprot:scaffold169160_cov23-Tisochrysis_lutea.AAC.4